jgi:hypothetical protein
MKVVDRYISLEIVSAVSFALLAFLSLFAFFDLIGELPLVGRGGYRLMHAFAYVALGLPGYVYDLMPIAALIGAIYALAQFAARSEFTIMRASGLSPWMAGWILAKVGLVFVMITFLFGEVLAPASSGMAERLKLQAQGASISQPVDQGRHPCRRLERRADRIAFPQCTQGDPGRTLAWPAPVRVQSRLSPDRHRDREPGRIPGQQRLALDGRGRADV